MNTNHMNDMHIPEHKLSYLSENSLPFMNEVWLSLLHAFSSAAHEPDSDVAIALSS